MIRLLYIFWMIWASTALYPTNSDVVDLTADNFDRLVLNSNKVWIVQFFAPSCIHCINLEPEYSKAATALKGVVEVGAVNAKEYKSLSNQYDVRGFPTIKIFGTNKSAPQNFTGPKTAQGIVESAFSAAKEHALSELALGVKPSLVETEPMPTMRPEPSVHLMNTQKYKYPLAPFGMLPLINSYMFSTEAFEKLVDDTHLSLSDNKEPNLHNTDSIDIPPYEELADNLNMEPYIKLSKRDLTNQKKLKNYCLISLTNN
ncbi:protein disulfide-isomerase A6 homolog [Ctenocephalides felis]|uniref:protein disulfide-isomerase A6 homolog n=1 Tax=Ctenocephalides felis TaxID=7515 RepID=UPI000E6E15B1|nr:protein disulfide-isomerase A6 homolog [Ctenocephalides felis]